MKKPKGYWTKERCSEEALKYETRNALKIGSRPAYAAAHRNGWLDAICKHMQSKIKPAGYWTEDRIRQQALKYSTRSDFASYDQAAYHAAQRQNLLDVVCAHMKKHVPQPAYWTEERIYEVARTFQTRTEFSKQAAGAYNAACKKNILDSVCSHMEELRKPKGYWTKERCAEAALQYKTRIAFRKGPRGAYSAARRNGWLTEICKHMDLLIKPAGYWTEDRIQKQALKCETRTEFEQNCKDAYTAAQRRNLLDAVCAHMRQLQKPDGYWTKEIIHEQALKCETRTEFEQNCKDAYAAAQRRNLLDTVCAHMGVPYKPAGYWTEDRIRQQALKYDTRWEFQKNEQSAYSIAHRRNLLDDVCAHMEELRKPHGYWTEDRIQQQALKYDTRGEFKQNSKYAYAAAQRQNLLDDVCSHMEELRKPDGYWTKEIIHEQALKYDTRTDFARNDPAPYAAAKRLGIIDEVCSHMLTKSWDRSDGIVYLYPLNASRSLVKIGICNFGNLQRRVLRVATQFEGSLSAVFAIKSVNAKQVEAELKSYGTKVEQSDLDNLIVKLNGSRKLLSGKRAKILDGYTEMRWSSADDFEAKLDVMRKHSLDGRVTLHKDIGGSLEPVLFI